MTVGATIQRSEAPSELTVDAQVALRNEETLDAAKEATNVLRGLVLEHLHGVEGRATEDVV